MIAETELNVRLETWPVRLATHPSRLSRFTLETTVLVKEPDEPSVKPLERPLLKFEFRMLRPVVVLLKVRIDPEVPVA